MLIYNSCMTYTLSWIAFKLQYLFPSIFEKLELYIGEKKITL